MKAKNPIDKNWYYFIDKCMPFGASISCSHFQRFSDAVAQIFRHKSGGEDTVNYLDDYFFAALMEMCCNRQISTFLQICEKIRFPVSLEKTFWGSQLIVFLGTLINTETQTISIPVEKIDKARQLLDAMLIEGRKKTTLIELQQLCGLLNFFSKSIIPARAFTRRLYAHTAKALKPLHHININAEMRLDFMMWKAFIDHPSVFSRQFIDLTSITKANEIDFYTDASRNFSLGCGGVCGNEWYALQWDRFFMQINQPSINYLELYAVLIGVILWIEKFKNKRVVIFCDNMSVVHMINNNSSNCKNCMILIRILVLQGLVHNTRIYAKHVRTHLNKKADLLSRAKFQQFRVHAAKDKMKHTPREIPELLWPMHKVWSRN